MSNARFNGVISGIGAGDTVDKIEIVWKAGNETESAAQSGGRYVTYQSPANNTMITAFQGAGQIVDIGTLSPGVTYTPSVRITEKRSDLTLAYGAWATGTPIITAPSAPTGISAQSGNTTLTVSWTPGTGATSSLIRWGTATGVYGSTTDPASSGYQITGLTNGVTTYYQVGSKNTAGITWSAEQTALSNASPVFSAQPTLQSATTTTATITYGTSDAELDHYKREISNNGGVTWYDGTVENETPGTGKTATITGLTAGTSYTTLVKLTPLTGNLATVTSNSVSVLTLPSAPTISNVMPGNTQNVITISAATGAASYNLYWTSDGSDPTSSSTKITGAVSPHTHPGLTNGLTYKYKCEAVNTSGVSSLSAVASGTPNLGFSDDFNRVNGTLGSNWVTRTFSAVVAPQIVSNAVPHPGSSQLAAALSTEARNANQYAQIDITPGGASYYMGVDVRATGNLNTSYRVLYMNNNIYLYKYISGAATQLGSTVTQTGVTKLRLEANGTTVTAKAYFNSTWNTVNTQTDASIASGSTGFCLFDVSGTSNSFGTIDNFSTGNL